MRVWDVASGVGLQCTRCTESPIEITAFSRDGEQIVSGGWHGTVNVWDTASGTELRQAQLGSGVVCQAIFKPNDNTIQITSLSNVGSTVDHGHRRELSGRCEVSNWNWGESEGGNL